MFENLETVTIVAVEAVVRAYPNEAIMVLYNPANKALGKPLFAVEMIDADGFLALMRRLRSERGDIAIPVFDRKDDLARGSARIVGAKQRLLIIEGNYLLLNRPVWQELPSLFDLTVFLHPSLATIEARLIQRWLDNGCDAATAALRARGNDLTNAQTVLAHSTLADIVLQD
jgi:pantothenate kinase